MKYKTLITSPNNISIRYDRSQDTIVYHIKYLFCLILT